MMTVGEVIALLTEIFSFLFEYLGKFFGGSAGEEEPAPEEDATV